MTILHGLFFYEGERQMIACNESSPGETRLSQAGPRVTAKSLVRAGPTRSSKASVADSELLSILRVASSYCGSRASLLEHFLDLSSDTTCRHLM